MSDYRYPITMLDGDADYLLINVLEYCPPGTGGAGQDFSNFFNFSKSGGKKGKRKSKHSMILPIPEGIQDMNAVSWRGDNLNAVQAAAFRAGESIVNAGNLTAAEGNVAVALKNALEAGGQQLQGFLAQLENNSEVRDSVKSYFITQAVNTFGTNISANSIFSRATGQVLNPNLELLFDGVQLRSFQFSFPLTPRNEQESLQIKGMIRTFKQSMAAKTGGSGGSRGLFIASPDVFRLEFKKGRKKHPFYFTMKECALKGMNVNYMETQSYATYEDGTPVKMRLNLQFTEVNPIYAEDYDSIKDGVGY